MAASSKEILQKYGITHILTVAKGYPPQFPSFFTYKVIPVLDLPGTILKRKFGECIEFIKKAQVNGGTVLVHCFAGVSRSATIVCAYLMQEHNLSYSAALKLVKSKRPFVNPNDGFRTQLVQFQKELKEKKLEQ
jgi:dual specificity phosphatase 12